MEPILLIGAPVVLGLVEGARKAGVPDRILPLASVACGIVAAALLALRGDISWPEAPFAGLMVGLSASGLHSGGRTTIGTK